jgi:hypothetical protein
MARALKISKYGPAQGITINSNGTINQPAAAVSVDVGYPNFGSLTDPVYNVPTTLTSSNFLGVVGGFQEGQVSATYPIIRCQVNILRNNGTSSGTASGNGRILRQKGAHKFLVARASNIQDENIVLGNTYMIASVGTTNWALFGASPNAAVGDMFTATAAGTNSGNGYVWDVGVCVLSNTASPAAGYMSIGFSTGGDSSLVYASYISNKWIRDWSGMTYGNYSNSNTGVNNYANENFYPTNFFTDTGTVTWSGAEVINSATAQNGTLPLAQVQKFTS